MSRINAAPFGLGVILALAGGFGAAQGQEKAAAPADKQRRLAYVVQNSATWDLGALLKQHFKDKPDVQVLEDGPSHCLLISAPSAVFDEVAGTLARLDRRPRRINVEMLMAVFPPPKDGDGKPDPAAKAWDFKEFNGPAAAVVANLEALRNRGQIDTLRRLHLSLWEDRQSILFLGESKPYVRAATVGPGGMVTRNILRSQVGAQVQATAHISPDKKVELALNLVNGWMSPNADVVLAREKDGTPILMSESFSASFEGKLSVAPGQAVVVAGVKTEMAADPIARGGRRDNNPAPPGKGQALFVITAKIEDDETGPAGEKTQPQEVKRQATGSAPPAKPEDAATRRRQTYVVQHRKAADLAALLSKHFRGEAAIQALPEGMNNCLLMSGPAAILDEAVQLLPLLDRRSQTVGVEVWIAERPSRRGDERKPEGNVKDLDPREFNGPAADIVAKLEALRKAGQISTLRRLQLSVSEDERSTIFLGESKSYVNGISNMAGGVAVSNLLRQNVGSQLGATVRMNAAKRFELQLSLTDSWLDSDPTLEIGKNGNDSVFATENFTFQVSSKLSLVPGEAVAVEGDRIISPTRKAQSLIIVTARLVDADARPGAGGKAETVVQTILKMGGSIQPADATADAQITTVNLRGTPATDTVLKQVKQLKNLEHLYLGGTNVTDTGLKELKELKKLQFLGLLNTKVTEAGVKELQEALPKCDIVR